jgi:hypothetical protein
MKGNPTLVLDGQRKLARSILIGLVTAVVLFVLFASGPNFGLSFAQQQEPRVEFLNPSGTNFSEEVSSKPDGTGSTYHLVAWVNDVPTSPGVEFRYVDPDTSQEVTIGAATQTGIPDTFDLSWDPPSTLPEEEEITLIAVLLSGTTELDRDTEEDIILNEGDPDPLDPTDDSETQGETVEIVSPAVGGAWGMFTPRDRATAGVLNVSMSADVTNVRAVYTVTDPGNEPIWVDCGTEEAAAAADGVRCTISSQHDRTEVTAVGVIANDSPEDPIFGGFPYDSSFDDSGDAHRVQTYEQVPGSIVLDQATQDNAPVGDCSRLFTATLTDQFSVPIVNANVDVHGRGPSEELAFDDGTTASAHKPPDKGLHTTETARTCADDPPPPAGQQGKHTVSTGLDIKHIESAVSAGTDDAGKWTFQLFSPQAGVGEFVIWADVDDDDAHCATEKSVSGSVGWGTAAGSSSLAPDVATCPSPSPTTPGPGPTTPSPTPTDNPRGCTVFGTDEGETLEGTENDDVICAEGGDDIVNGLGGNDVIYGDEGRDDIRGGDGNDEIHGGAGKDTVRGNDGNDDLLGDIDNDVITGGAGDDVAQGGAGSDTVRGSSGNDDLRGQGGSDNLTGGPGKDVLTGGRGKDSLLGGPDKDRCTGNGGRDTFSGCETQRK